MSQTREDRTGARGPDAITLDLFGTLVDFSIPRDEKPLVAELLAGTESSAEPSRVLATWVKRSLAERACTPFRTVHDSLVQGARETADVHDLSIDPIHWTRRLETLWTMRPLFEDVPAALDRLKRHAIPWAIVSNVDKSVLEALLEKSGLGSRSPTVVSSHKARAYKPHPRPFRMAQEQLKGAPTRVLHVGDSPGEDRAGAKAARMAWRLVDPPDRTLSSVLDEILQD